MNMPRSRGAGQSLVEFALVLPLLFLLIVNAINFGGFFYAWITVAGFLLVIGSMVGLGSITGATRHGGTFE